MFQELIGHLAKTRLLTPVLQRPIGRDGKKLEDSALLAMFTSSLRRAFSYTGVKAQSRLLLDRLDLLSGEGPGQVVRRKCAAEAEERAAANERMAQVTALRESRAVVRRGMFMER